jgi:hypothetical protein
MVTIMAKIKVDHVLKTENPYFDQVWNKEKTFEFRENDRGFRVNNLLMLKEYDKVTNSFSGREILVRVTYILNIDQFVQIDAHYGYVIMSIKTLLKTEEQSV